MAAERVEKLNAGTRVAIKRVEVDVDAAMEISRLVGRRCRGGSLAAAVFFLSPWSPELKNLSSFHRHFNLFIT
jgi:hypothetical protein